MTLIAHVLIFSCRLCAHFRPKNRCHCELYYPCKAGRPLADTPGRFKRK